MMTMKQQQQQLNDDDKTMSHNNQQWSEKHLSVSKVAKTDDDYKTKTTMTKRQQQR